MFVLTEMKDTVRLQPWQFGHELEMALAQSLNDKFANRVVHNVGLCIALWDLVTVDDSFIFPGDGASHTIVQFRYVVFRPFIDEILEGKIKSCSKEGVHVCMGFYDDIFIPADSLQNPSTFDEQEQLWAWEYEMEDEKHNLFMDLNEKVRFRVIEEIFVDLTPSGPDSGSTEGVSVEAKKVPYKLMGTINEPGLGLLSWWNSE